MIGGIDCEICKWANDFENPTKCKAFPKGIPKSILRAKEVHHEYRKGDNGIKFELVEPLTSNPKPWSPEDDK